jgi:hypothetical protein
VPAAACDLLADLTSPPPSPKTAAFMSQPIPAIAAYFDDIRQSLGVGVPGLPRSTSSDNLRMSDSILVGNEETS